MDSLWGEGVRAHGMAARPGNTNMEIRWKGRDKLDKWRLGYRDRVNGDRVNGDRCEETRKKTMFREK